MLKVEKVFMVNISFRTLENISLLDFTDIWNRCWQGYYFDMTYTPEYMKIWLYLSQISLQHSAAICVAEKIAGISLLSKVGTEGWIAGACIDPVYRQKGLFSPLISSQVNLASQIGLKKIFLEVIEENHAQKVYQSVGFSCTRRLYLYRAKKGIDIFAKTNTEYKMKPISEDLYFAHRRKAFFEPAWQRREDYLKRYKNSITLMNLAGTAGALMAGEDRALCLDAWSATKSGAEQLLTTLLHRSKMSFSLTNQPDDWISFGLSSRGIIPSAKQFEMCILI